MAEVRRVTITFRDSRGRIAKHEALVPATAFAGDIPMREELARLEVRKHLDVKLDEVVAVDIGDPFDPSEGVGFLI